jgi:hypothetical protein
MLLNLSYQNTVKYVEGIGLPMVQISNISKCQMKL